MLAWVRCTVCLTKRVSASNQRDGFFIVHRHPGKRLTDVAGCCQHIRLTVWSLWVDVNQTHLNCCERLLEVTVAGVALVAQPLGLRTPVDIFRWLPDIFTSAGETKRLESSRLKCAVAGENHQVSPGQLAAVLLLDRPEKHSSLVKVGVVRPAVQRREAEGASTGATTAIDGPVGSSAMPCHTDEEAGVRAVVRWPPVLACDHQFVDVGLHTLEVKLLELSSVVEVITHRVGHRGMLAKNVQTEEVWPPVGVPCAATCGCRHFCLWFSCHRSTAKWALTRRRGCWLRWLWCWERHTCCRR